MKDFSVLNVTHEISKYKLELKLKINTRSLFNRTLNPAHPPLRCCALLALRSIQVMTGLPCLLRRWGDTWGCWSPGGGGQGFAGLGFRFPACLSRLEEINHSMLGTHLSFSLAFLPGLSCPLILFSFFFFYYRCRQRLSRWLYQRWPALAGKGRSALSPAQPLLTRKAKIFISSTVSRTWERDMVFPLENNGYKRLAIW